jgi:hypothetical protein
MHLAHFQPILLKYLNPAAVDVCISLPQLPRHFIQTGQDSSDYVATSYRLDEPGSFPGSIFILSSSVFSVFCLYILFLVFCLYLYFTYVYVLYCTVDVHVLVLRKFVRCILLFS